MEPKSRQWVHTDYPQWYFMNANSYLEKLDTQFYSSDRFKFIQYITNQKQHIRGTSCLPQFSRYCFATPKDSGDDEYADQTELYTRLHSVQNKAVRMLLQIPMESYVTLKKKMQIKAGILDNFKVESILDISLDEVRYRLHFNDVKVVDIGHTPILFPTYTELSEQVGKLLRISDLVSEISKEDGT